MTLLGEHSGLYTDYYELAMAQGYFLNRKEEIYACFDYFFREIPFNGGYVIFAGLSDLLNILENYKFNDDSCAYLSSLGFNEKFLSHLKNIKLSLTIYAPKEGEVVFPNEPLIRIEGNIIEAQIVETLVLNTLNFQSLIATKASRIRQVAGDKPVSEYGLRRAQGLGGIHASKAAIIGGCDTTSNLYSAYMFGIEPAGTQAHSWIQSFGSELEAFREYAKIYPSRCILLVDTYDTLRSGIPNAITVGKELEKVGEKLRAIRLDSGDLAYLSKHARRMLDEAGLPYVKIIASNQLDEFIIRSLNEQNAPIDSYGVGTNLITGMDNAALDGVYKLAMIENKSILKISDNVEKMTLPGRKKVIRYINGEGMFNGDAIILDDEDEIEWMYHPFKPDMYKKIKSIRSQELLHPVLVNGELAMEKVSPSQIATYVRERLSMLSPEHKRFENPHVYKVGISKRLLDLRSKLYSDFRQGINS